MTSTHKNKTTIDDVAVKMLQLGSADTNGLELLKAMLYDVAKTYPLLVQAYSLKAVAAIDEILTGCKDVAGKFKELGDSVNEAVEASYEDEMECGADPSLVCAEDGGKDEARGRHKIDKADIGLFISDSSEGIEMAEAALLSLESDPDQPELINTIFRAVHNIKGSSGMLHLDVMMTLAHLTESILMRVRSKEIVFSNSCADVVLRSFDMIKELLFQLGETKGDGELAKPAGYDAQIGILRHLETATIVSEGDMSDAIMSGEGETSFFRRVGASVEKTVPSEPLEQSCPSTEGAKKKDSGAIESFVRVKTERLDKLIDMVGELVIAHSLVAQDRTIAVNDNIGFAKNIVQMGKIVNELQDVSMSMRMVPLKSTFQKLARIVRDVAAQSGKLVRFESEGENTEIDRNMVEVVCDPLIHMVRNSVDHGIESSEERLKDGKPEEGLVRLRAYTQGGSVVIEVVDDGRGLDRDKILAKAESLGVVDPSRKLTDSEIYNFIFDAGFSTADKVTDISGRGVGMDVVRRGVESLRGSIETSSCVGFGCVFTIRLPLTLGVTEGMLIKVGANRYIVATNSIHATFRPSSGMITEVFGRGEMVDFRGELLPMFRLHSLFRIDGAVEEPMNGLLLVVGEGIMKCALLVDELLSKQQVVAKSLGDGMGRVKGIAGGAILGDGRVGLILDISEVASLARCDKNGTMCLAEARNV